MNFDTFDRITSRARLDETALDAECVAACLSDLEHGFSALDQRLDTIIRFLPDDIRKSMEDAPFLDTFSAIRLLKLHTAHMQGVSAADQANAPCPYKSWQRAERDAWTKSYTDSRKLIEA